MTQMFPAPAQRTLTSPEELAVCRGQREWTARDLPASERRKLRNLPSQKSERIARLPAGLYWDGRTTADSKIVYDSGLTLAMNLLSYKKIGGAHIWGRPIRKLLKIYHRLF